MTTLLYHFVCDLCESEFSDEFEENPEIEAEYQDGQHISVRTKCDCSKKSQPRLTGRSYM